MSTTGKGVSFGQGVKTTTNESKGSTTTQVSVHPSGMGMPGTRNPVGSLGSNGRYTGDFKGLGVVNPWGGRKSKRYNKKTKRIRRRSRKYKKM
jgi:hypothetical protein